jgi:dCMP deaminase
MKINPRINIRPSWDKYFINLCEVIKTRSLDPNTQVGCCIVDKDNRIKATGYNSYPPGCRDEELPFNRDGEINKYNFIVHAETNAIASSAKVGVSLNDCTIYLPFYPCSDCFKSIVTAGIKCVKVYGKYESEKSNMNNKAVDILSKQAGIEIIHIESEK